MMWSIFPYESEFIEISSEHIDEIPCLKFRPKHCEDMLPTVILYHGWHSSKYFMRFKALILASFGYQVIAPDALYHGDREPIDHDDPENLDKFFWEIVIQSIKESKGFIDAVIKNHGANAGRLAVMGSSMGAVSAAGVFVRNTGIRCLIGINGSFAWQEAIEQNHLPSPAMDAKAMISLYDPINNGNIIRGRAVQILHGVEDTTIPIDSQRKFNHRILQQYKEGKVCLEFIEEPGINHITTMGMLERAVMWLKENL